MSVSSNNLIGNLLIIFNSYNPSIKHYKMKCLCQSTYFKHEDIKMINYFNNYSSGDKMEIYLKHIVIPSNV